MVGPFARGQAVGRGGVEDEVRTAILESKSAAFGDGCRLD